MNPVYHTTECAICYEEYKQSGNDCVLLKCGHIFHRSCLQSWVERRSICPACKSRTFIPLILRDILIEAAWKGIEGAKKFAFVCVCVAAVAVLHGVLNYFFPGRWPSTDAEIDEYIKEHGVLFDLRRPEGYLRLGLVASGVIGGFGLHSLIKELNRRRNQPPETATSINYRPPDECY